MGAPDRHAIPRVLYVDDDPVSRRIFEQLGKTACVAVDSCGSLDEGVALCRQRRYAVIAADYALRRWDGLSVLRELSGLEPRASLMLVTDGERKRELPSSLLNYVFVEKPVRRAEVARQLLDAIRASDERVTRPHLALFAAPVLLLAREEGAAGAFERKVAEHGGGRLRLTSTSDLEQAVVLLKSLRFSAVLVHAALGDAPLDEALTKFSSHAPDVPLVLVDADLEVLGEERQQDFLRRGIAIVRRGADSELAMQVLGGALERAERERRVQVLAATDAATGALNRATFYHLLEGKVAAREPFLLTGIRINDLGRINEELGQLGGDAVLAGGVRRLSSEFGARATLGRLGGAVLAALFEAPLIEEPARVRQKLEQAFELPFDLDDSQVRVEACSAAFEYPEGGRSAPELLQNLERALRELRQPVDPERRGQHSMRVQRKA